jgi:hypothetical protein
MFSFSRRSKTNKPQVLKGTDISSVAEYIKSNQCRTVMLMVRHTLFMLGWAHSFFMIVGCRLVPFCRSTVLFLIDPRCKHSCWDSGLQIP